MDRMGSPHGIPHRRHVHGEPGAAHWRGAESGENHRVRPTNEPGATSHQIRMQADRLLGPELSDVDGNTEQRVGTISVFNGPPPTIRVLASIEEQATWWVHGLWTSATLA